MIDPTKDNFIQPLGVKEILNSCPGEIMRCRKEKRILRYHVRNKLLAPEKLAHHELLLFYSFRDTKELPVVPEKIKWSPLIPVCRLVIFVLSTISFFNWRRWFVSWLTVNPAFPLSDLTVGVEIMTLQYGTCSLKNF